MKNNHINADGLVAIVEMLYGEDEAKLKLTRDICSECADVTHADRCEAAFEVILCTRIAHEARGLMFGSM